MMIFFATAAVAVIVAMIWPWRAGARAVANDLDEAGAVARALVHLRDRGVDASELRFRLREDAHRAVVFVKRIVARNTILVRGTFCDDRISPERFEAVKEALASRGIPYATAALNGHGCLTIEVINDMTEAERFVRTVFECGFNADIARDGVAYSKDTLVVNARWLTGVDGKAT